MIMIISISNYDYLFGIYFMKKGKKKKKKKDERKYILVTLEFRQVTPEYAHKSTPVQFTYPFGSIE